jgi:hypothetical protein
MPKGPSAPAPSESTSLDFELVQRLTFGGILSGGLTQVSGTQMLLVVNFKS